MTPCPALHRAPKRERGPIRLLLVEDDEDIRDALLRSLEAEGYRVTPAANGVEALDRLQDSTEYGLILLDLMMPVMNGEQFRAEQVKASQLARIPVVVLSANRQARQKAAEIGAAACIVKPIDLDALLAAIERNAIR